MAQKIPTVKVRVLRSFYYLDLLPDGTWSRAATYKASEQIIPMKLMDAIENRTTKKVEFVREEAAVTKEQVQVQVEEKKQAETEKQVETKVEVKEQGRIKTRV